MSKQYTVQAPDGKTITLEGPDNATPEEVIQQAQLLYPSAGVVERPAALDVKPVAKQPVIPKNPVRPVEATGYPTATSGLRELAIGALEPFALQNAPDMAGGALDIIKNALSGKAVPLVNQAAELAKAPFRPPIEYIKALAAGNPDEAARAAGGIISQTLPAAYGVKELGGDALAALKAKAGSIKAFQPTEVKAAIPAKVIKEAVPERLAKPFEPGRIIEPAKPEVPLDSATVNKWMNVPAKQVKLGGNPGKRLMDEGLLGPTKEATQANVTAKLDTVGKSLGSELKKAGASGTEIDIQTPVYDAAARAKKLIGKKTDVAFQKSIDQVVDDIESEIANLPNASPVDAHAFKSTIGDQIDWHATTANPINDMLIEIYRDINKAIKNKVPQAAGLQDQWRDLHIANSSLRDSLARDIVGTGTGSVAPGNTPPVPAVTKPGQAPVVKAGKPAVVRPETPAVMGPSPASKFVRATAKKALPYGAAGLLLREYLDKQK